MSPTGHAIGGPGGTTGFPKRLAFAHLLRGVAALSVLASHYLDMFWTEPAVIASLLGVPAAASRQLPGWYRGILATLSPHGMGQFGVALFFLISGFVIPFSLLSLSRTAFLVARAMRLWPTYAVGFAVTMLAVWFCSSWFGQPFPGSARAIAAHILFVRDLLWLPSLDGIGWTLEVELKFYLVCALFANSIRAGRIATFLAIAGGAVVVTLAISRSPALVQPGWYYAALRVVTLNAQMICYMLIGTTMNAMYRGRISARNAFIVGGTLFCAFAVQWPLGLQRGLGLTSVAAYAGALATFAVFYWRRDAFDRPSGLLAGLADISYPLYVVHGVAGYALIRVLLDRGAPAVAAVPPTLIAALAVASTLHVTIERPTQRLGRRMARMIDRRGGSAAIPERRRASPVPPS